MKILVSPPDPGLFDRMMKLLSAKMPVIANGKRVYGYPPIGIWRLVPDELLKSNAAPVHCGWRVFLRKGMRLFSVDLEVNEEDLALQIIRSRAATKLAADRLFEIEQIASQLAGQSCELRYLVSEFVGFDSIWLYGADIDAIVSGGDREVRDRTRHVESLKVKWQALTAQ